MGNGVGDNVCGVGEWVGVAKESLERPRKDFKGKGTWSDLN